MGWWSDLTDTMSGCLLGGGIAGQFLAVGVLGLLAILVVSVAGYFLFSRLSAIALVVALFVGTTIIVYAVGAAFSVFEDGRSEIDPSAPRHARCREDPANRDVLLKDGRRLALRHVLRL